MCEHQMTAFQSENVQTMYFAAGKMSPGGFFQQNWAIHLLMDLAQEYDYVKISQSIDLIEDDIIK